LRSRTCKRNGYYDQIIFYFIILFLLFYFIIYFYYFIFIILFAANGSDPEKGVKSHKQRVEEFNNHLDSLSEHYDIPKVSWTK